MGCNCKNKNTQQKIKTTQVGNDIILVNQEPPPYTWEEVIAVNDYIDSKVKTQEGFNQLAEFSKNYFGEVIVGYCDINCLDRTRKRIEVAKERLQEYQKK